MLWMPRRWKQVKPMAALDGAEDQFDGLFAPFVESFGIVMFQPNLHR